jgi:ribosomal-protein-alanine N-acetyltransferase
MTPVLRPFRPGDAADLARQANDPAVAANVRDVFPHPYTRADAEAWIERCRDLPAPVPVLAITLDDRVVGGIGVFLQTDVYRINAEIGYWLGQAYWGRGIATSAVRQMTAYAFAHFPDLHRLYAGVFGPNRASARVLEKAGYALEAIHPESILKNGQLLDEHVYAIRRNRKI